MGEMMANTSRTLHVHIHWARADVNLVRMSHNCITFSSCFDGESNDTRANTSRLQITSQIVHKQFRFIFSTSSMRMVVYVHEKVTDSSHWLPNHIMLVHVVNLFRVLKALHKLGVPSLYMCCYRLWTLHKTRSKPVIPLVASHKTTLW